MSLGTDLAALPAFDGQRLRREGENLAEALARRLITPRGGLFYDPEYGTDLRAYLKEPATDALRYEIERAAALEAEKDPRVEAATATVTRDGADGLRLRLDVTTAEGPFRMVLRVDTLTVEVLYGPR